MQTKRNKIVQYSKAKGSESLIKQRNVPDEDELDDMIEVGLAEADEVVEREVVRNSNDEEESGLSAMAWQRRVSYASKQVGYASSLAEFGGIGVRV